MWKIFDINSQQTYVRPVARERARGAGPGATQEVFFKIALLKKKRMRMSRFWEKNVRARAMRFAGQIPLPLNISSKNGQREKFYF